MINRFVKFTAPIGMMVCLGSALLTTPAGEAVAQDERSAFIDNIAVGSTWLDITANEGNNLRIDVQAVAYSGGGTANGRTVVFGGGHNNGLNDAVAVLDWRQFETEGWTEDFQSTADHIGVGDDDWQEIGEYLNANYDGSTPGGILDGRGYVALSRHTYDQMVILSDHFYVFSGVLSFSNPGQPPTPWRTPDEGDIWRYDYGSGWTYIDNPIALQYTGHAAAAEDTLTGNIWVHDGTGLRLFDTTTETLGPPGDYLDSQIIESSLNFNPDDGAEGTLFGAGQYAGPDWHEYDIATGQQRNMGSVPGSSTTTYIIYVAESFGADYGTYFAFVPNDGTLRRWNGSGWDTIATGGPAHGDYVYGRAGFESVHQTFYWITTTPRPNPEWKTFLVRPFAFSGSVAQRPTVSLSADPETVGEQGSTTLSWNSSDATSCTASGDWSGPRATTGSESIGPLSDSATFALTCSGPGGTVARSVNVTVQGALPAPVVSLSADPLVVDEGSFSTISWTAADASSCEASGDWSGTRETQGSESVGPLASDISLTLMCTGPGGNGSASVNVTVNAAPAPPPPPPPPPGGSGGSNTSNGGQQGGGVTGIACLVFLSSLVCVSRYRKVRRAGKRLQRRLT